VGQFITLGVTASDGTYHHMCSRMEFISHSQF